MAEMAHPGEDHGKACLVGGLDDLLVAHRAARLDHRGGAGFRRGNKPVGEGEEGVGRRDRSLGQRFRLAGGNCCVGRLAGGDALRVRELLLSAGLPVDPPRLGRVRMLELMGMDKKVKGGEIRLVLLDGIGRATVTADYPREALEALLEERAGA